MKQFSYRDTWAEISIHAIQENVREFKEYINSNVTMMAIVKADGYGHGAVEVAKAALEAGAEFLGVALLDEALQLREAGIKNPILILGYTPVRSIQKAILEGITLTVFDEVVLKEIISQASFLRKTASIHLKIDTGMSRIGLASAEDTAILAKKAILAPYVYLEGIFTHFANADSEDSAYTLEQFERFTSVIGELEKEGIHIPLKHCCNSAATMNYPEMHLDMVRVGIALYGLYPDHTLKKHRIHLKQAMCFKTRIAAIKNVPAKQPISYGCTWIPEKKSMVATLPIGYADGLSRMLSNKGTVLVNGVKAPIIGRVCMDQTMIDVTHLSHAKVGDEVTIFGNNASAFQSVDEISKWTGTINYETVCAVGKRVPRMYNFDRCQAPTIFLEDQTQSHYA